MTIFVMVMTLLLGLAILIAGAEALVRGATSLAKRLRISDLAIGLTVVAFGTSAPELAVNVMASIDQKPGIVFGNIVGSNICNILLILGLSGLIKPLVVQRSMTWKEIPLALGTSLILLLLMTTSFLPGELSPGLFRVDGAILLLFFCGFMFYVYRMMRRDRSESSEDSAPVGRLPFSILLVIAGLAALIAGGSITVNQAVEMARLLAVDERLIALTIVAIGTSLPELATSVVAAWKGNADIAVGNVVGSNIFNVLFILGSSVVISPVPYLSSYLTDLLVMTMATVLLFGAMFFGNKHRVDRWEAGSFLMIYVGYTAFLFGWN